MGKRARRRSRPGPARKPTRDYADAEGNVIELRGELSDGSRRALGEAGDTRPGASQEDVWQRRTEMLFERLVVRWTIAGLPLEGQRELLGRYRLADGETRRWLRKTLESHLAEL